MLSRKRRFKAISKASFLPHKLEVDVGPRIGEKMFPQVMKAWWFMALLIAFIFIVGMIFMLIVFSRFSGFVSKFPF